MADTEAILKEALDAIASSEDEKSLEDIRVHVLGKKGSLTALLKNLGQLPPEERPAAGEGINKAKQQVQQATQVVTRRRDRLVTVMKKRKTLEKLKEKEWLAHQQKMMQVERKFNDEVAANRHVRKM